MPRTLITMPRVLVKDFGTCLDCLNGTQTCTFVSATFSNTIVSVAFYFKPRKVGSGSFDVQLGYSNQRWFFIYAGATTQIRWSAVLGGVERTAGTSPSMVLGRWYLIIGTYDASGGSNNMTCRIYDIASNSLFSSLSSTQTGTIGVAGVNLKAGHDSNRGLNVNAQFDDIYVFDRLLSVAEQDALALNQAISLTSLQLLVKFNEGSGTNATDSSGNGHDGTLSGGATWGTDVVSKSRVLVP